MMILTLFWINEKALENFLNGTTSISYRENDIFSIEIIFRVYMILKWTFFVLYLNKLHSDFWIFKPENIMSKKDTELYRVMIARLCNGNADIV